MEKENEQVRESEGLRSNVVLMFVSGFAGTSKKGNSFNMTTMYQIIEDRDNTGKLKSKELSFFTEKPLAWEKYTFGDLVECSIEQPEMLDEGPKLVSINKVILPSPYLKILNQ